MSVQQRSELEKRVEHALDQVRPHLAVDGGDVELVEVTDQQIVRIKWLGTCVNCSMSAMTMKAGIESAIRSAVPEISSVEAINGLEIDPR